MLDHKERCDYRLQVCLYVLCLFTVVCCYDPCPLTVRNSFGNKAPNIPEYMIESAFYTGEWVAYEQNRTRKSVRVYPKEMKIPETVHPQANPKPQIYRMEERQLVFDTASRYLTASYDLSPTRESCGLPKIHPTGEAGIRASESCFYDEEIVCNSTAKYRTADGSCNNLNHPHWGRAFSPFLRLFPPSRKGEDGLTKAAGCNTLPHPRSLSTFFEMSHGRRARKVNHLYVSFGQFLTHDMTLTAQSTTENNEAIQCCPPRPDNHPQCAPIDLTQFPIYRGNSTCMNFVRSAMYPTCDLGHRTQINTVSSFIDGSQIYGNSQSEMNSLRALDGTGKLLVQESRVGPLLPRSTNPTTDRCSVPQNNQFCFLAGDSRVNQNPALTSWHTIWLREHNRLATMLKRMNAHWEEERIFEEARRIVIGELQKIVLREYLPLTLGDKYIKSILPEQQIAYNSDINPTLWTEFSTAAFRFGHSMVDGPIPESPRRSGHNGHLMRDKFADPMGLYEGEVDLVMMGASRTPAQAVDTSMVTDVISYLYRTRGQPAGLDLAALNIQRGRDHALPSYFDVYNVCNSDEPIESFYDLEEYHVMTQDTIEHLRHRYHDVKDVDLWVGIIAEIPSHEGVIGPTGSCIVAYQFQYIISGDRYWYSHKNQAGSFTNSQMSYFEYDVKLAHIICANTNITEIPWNAMETPSPTSFLTQCVFSRGDPWIYAWQEY